MANALYVKGKEKILSASINFSTDAIKCALVKSSYSPDLATDEFFSVVAVHALGDSISLSGKSVLGGTFDADDITFTTPPSGQTAGAVVIYKDTGSPATSPLIAYINAISGFPLATNGGNVGVQWDNGAYKIFSL